MSNPNIFLELDFDLHARVGCYDHERVAPQKIEVFVRALCPALPQSDCLERTLDYTKIHQHLSLLSLEKHYDLIETLTFVMLTSLKDLAPLWDFEIRVNKPQALPQARRVSCRLVSLAVAKALGDC